MSTATEDQIANAPIREAVLSALEKGDIASWSDLCDRLGWRKGSDGKYDTSKARRTLGLLEDRGSGVREQMSREDAAAIVRAIGVDPIDVGL